MATTHYNLPTINGTDTIDGVNAINGLANAVDNALYQVEESAGGGGSTPGYNSINTAMLQDQCVTQAKLSTQVWNNIQTGVSAAGNASDALSTAKSASQAAQRAETAANSVKTAWEQSPHSIKQSFNGLTSTAYAWGNIVVIQLAGEQVPGNTKTKVGQINPSYAPTQVITGTCASLATGAMRTGYMQVDTSGAVYVNMSTGSSTQEVATGVLCYLSNVN